MDTNPENEIDSFEDFDTQTGNEDVVTLTKEEYVQLSKKANALPQLTKRLNDLKNRPQNITKQEESKGSMDDEVLDLRLDGYSKDEVKFILQNGGRQSLEDKNSFVSIALNTKREQARAEDAANKVVDMSGLSEIERKYTPEQLEAMSVKELEAILPRA